MPPSHIISQELHDAILLEVFPMNTYKHPIKTPHPNPMCRSSKKSDRAFAVEVLQLLQSRMSWLDVAESDEFNLLPGWPRIGLTSSTPATPL